jgi:hypothetical protein
LAKVDSGFSFACVARRAFCRRMPSGAIDVVVAIQRVCFARGYAAAREHRTAFRRAKVFVEGPRSLDLDRWKTMFDPGHPRLSTVRLCELMAICSREPFLSSNTWASFSAASRLQAAIWVGCDRCRQLRYRLVPLIASSARLGLELSGNPSPRPQGGHPQSR